MKRQGQELRKLEAGHRRRMSDGKNAFRKMTTEQRETFLRWIIAGGNDNRGILVSHEDTVQQAVKLWEAN